MPTLREIQERFTAAIFTPDAAQDDLLALLEEPGAVGRQRLATYRRSVIGNLLHALEATYPVVAKIVGGPFFREAGRQYVLAHPSRSGDLNEYGGDFADFLADYAHAAELPYLPDTARLEWLIQTVYYAPDSPPPALQSLASLPPEAWARLAFEVAPAHARLDSCWPIADIWTVNQPGFAGDMAVDFSRSARALVVRPQGLVSVQALNPGEAALFDAIAAGEVLGTALASAAAIDPSLEPATAFQRFAATGVLLGVHPRSQ